MCVWVLLHVCVCVHAPCGVISCHCLKWMTLKHHSRFFFRHFFLPFFFLTFIHAHIFVFGELEVMLPIYGALKDGVKRGRLRQRQKERKQEREEIPKALKAWGYLAYDSKVRYRRGEVNTTHHLAVIFISSLWRSSEREEGSQKGRKEGRQKEKEKKGQQTHTDTQCHNCQRFCSFFFLTCYKSQS